MKNRYIIHILLFVCMSVTAQTNKTITKDSILSYFKKMSPFDVLNTLYETGDYNIINYDSLRNDKELKSYFLKCLNQNEYFEYKKQQEDKDFLNQINRNPQDLKREINYYLKTKNRSKEIDSILASSRLVLKFKDSVIFYRKILIRKGENIETYYPRMDILVNFHYPEVYAFLKNIYNKHGKEYQIKRFNDHHINTELFFNLLSFNDPEIQKEYDLQLKTILEKRYLDVNFGILFTINTAYGLKAARNFLLINDDVVFLSDGSKFPYNCELTNQLIEIFKNENIKLNESFTKELSDSRKYFDKCEIYKKYQKTILLNLDELVQQRRNKEEKWMQEMPFYKKK